jgi:hypothetical protein
MRFEGRGKREEGRGEGVEQVYGISQVMGPLGLLARLVFSPERLDFPSMIGLVRL